MNNLHIHYNEYGHGEPMILVHGFPFSSAMWNAQVEYFSKHVRVITYDIRGHGESEIGDGQFFLEDFVEDFFALLDVLRCETVIAVGLSMGGYILLRAYEQSPARFRALVLCDTKSEADSNEVKLKRAIQAKEVKTRGVKNFADGFLKAVLTDKTFSENAQAVELIRNIMLRTSSVSIAGTLLALASRTDTTHVLSSITIPTLLLVGENDSITTVSAMQAMKEKIPNAQWKILSNAGHLSNIENPSEFNFALETFLQSMNEQTPQ
jgi:pimeloyl-ACP methyl ester carboxylesterase